MRNYNVKSVDNMSGFMMLTINGNGDGLKNNVMISDENGNVFVVDSIAMASKKTVGDETILSVSGVDFNKPIGKILSIVS